MALFPSEDWILDLCGRVNASSEYRDAAATWEGDISFVFGAEPIACCGIIIIGLPLAWGGIIIPCVGY